MAFSREKLIRNAEKFVSRGRIEAAIREYRKVLADQPKDTGTLNRVGDLYARINKIDEAVRLFTQIAEQYTEEGFFVKAIAIYKKIIKLDPTRLGVYEKLAGLYHRQGLVNEARTQYQVLADYYIKHSNAASAISIYQQMADLEPEDPAHRAKLAELYQQEQLNDKAMEQYQLIADIMLEHERVDQAVQVLQRGLEVNPDDLDFLAMAVDKLRAAGQNEGARQLLAVAKEKNPAAESLMASVPEEEEEEIPSIGIDLEGAPGDEDLSVAPTMDLGSLADGSLEDLPFEGGSFDAGSFDEGAFNAGSFGEGALTDAAPGQADVVELPGLSGQDDLLDRDDALQRAMAEAEAAIGGDQDDTSQPLDDGDILLEWDDADSESLIAPPPDMAEKGPEVAGSGFAKESPEEDPAQLTDSWEIDLSDLDLGEDSVEVEALPVETAEPVEAAEPTEPTEPTEAEERSEADDEEFDLGPVSADDFDFGRGLEEEAEEAREEPPVEPEEDPGEQTLHLDEAFLELPEAPEPPELSIVEEEEESAPAPEETTFEDMLSEAEVLAKYGLREKAFERVEQVLVVEADHLGAHRVLIQLQLEDGNEQEVRDLAAKLQRLTAEMGDTREWEKVEGLFAAAGFSLAEKPKKTLAPKRAPKGDRPTGDRIDRLLASLLEDKAPAASPPRKAKKQSPADLLSGLVPSVEKGKKPPATVASSSEAPSEETAEPAATTPSPSPAGVPSRTESEDTNLVLGQPPQELNLEDDSDIDDALASMSPVFEIPVLPSGSFLGGSGAEPSDEVLEDDTGTSWLDEVEAEREQAEKTDELFEEEEGFFDLAAELEEELTVSDALGTQQEGEQTLEEIVEGFKRGVEEHLSEQDYDTHFDLGIAYREMGLLDEAIGEFQLASKAPEHLASCCSMLGICFLDKGLPELAIKWYTRGLESPSLSEDDSLALLYDLGSVYRDMGDLENARKTFVEVYGIRSSYRDVSDQLATLDPS